MLNLASHLPSVRLRMVPPPFAFRFVLFAKITSLSSKFAESFSQSIVLLSVAVQPSDKFF